MYPILIFNTKLGRRPEGLKTKKRLNRIAKCIPLAHRMPNSTEDAFLKAHQMPLAKSPPMSRSYPLPAYLSEIPCIYVF